MFYKREAHGTVHTVESSSHPAGAGSDGETRLTQGQLGQGIRQNRVETNKMLYFLTLVV